MSEVAVVTGANRGIGLEVVRQVAERGLRVFLTAWDETKGAVAAASLAGEVHVAALDVSDQGSVERFARWAADTLEGVDVLVNNAAILYDTWERARDADLAVVHRALATNLLRAWGVTHRSRYMGASLTMIDRHYGHLARDGRVHAIKLLDSYTGSNAADVHAVDAAWTLETRFVAGPENDNSTWAGANRKPPDGLEPPTPSLSLVATRGKVSASSGV
jgi:NAD(P)-dependent dehydrogenase (short-subunit alcohol dehydrogenase family)